MMRNSIIALGIVSLTEVTLAGCGSSTSVLHSPDSKYVVTCSGESCDTYRKAGYIEGRPPARPVPPSFIQAPAPPQ
jgi:hypothetical protein